MLPDRPGTSGYTKERRKRRHTRRESGWSSAAPANISAGGGDCDRRLVVRPLRLGEQAAVDPDRLGGHEFAHVARKKHDGSRDVERRSDPPKRRKPRPRSP